MPEMRHDPVQRRWVVIATERNNRLTDSNLDYGNLYVEQNPNQDGVNPFAEGNEHLTPPEIYAVRDPNTHQNEKGWRLRVVSNKYPALTIEGDINRVGMGLYDRMNGVGAHEVVIETPDVNADLAYYEPDHAFEIGKAYRSRLTDLMKDKRFRYVLVFRNHGRFAGSSIFHPHSQIVAMPVTPLIISKELDSAKTHFLTKERCLFCDILDQEIRENKRIVTQNDDYIAFTPYASRFPYEICLMPKKHHHDFRCVDDNQMRSLINLLQEVLQRLHIALNDPPYNLVLHTSPNTESKTPRPTHWSTIQYDWHWHIEIIPRLTNVAGFEWGTGIFINPTSPEQAAELLRSIVMD